jgi:phosphoribosylformylglycinamidine synthase
MVYAAESGLLSACHDISDGGLLTTVAEMALGNKGDGALGVELDFPEGAGLSPKAFYFSEEPGFVLEASEENLTRLGKLAEKYQVGLIELGRVISAPVLRLSLKKDEKPLEIALPELAEAWLGGLAGVLL